MIKLGVLKDNFDDSYSNDDDFEEASFS